MKYLIVVVVLLTSGCSMIQSRREMMVEACKKQPDLIIYSSVEDQTEWEMGCKKRGTK